MSSQSIGRRRAVARVGYGGLTASLMRRVSEDGGRGASCPGLILAAIGSQEAPGGANALPGYRQRK